MYSPSLHCSHSDLKQGVSAELNPAGFFNISIIEFFRVHQYDSMNHQAGIEGINRLQTKGESAMLACDLLAILPRMQNNTA